VLSLSCYYFSDLEDRFREVDMLVVVDDYDDYGMVKMTQVVTAGLDPLCCLHYLPE